MKKTVLCLLAMIMVLTSFASGEVETVNIIKDPTFIQGANVIAPPKPMRFVGRIKLSDEATESPKWLLTQWNSQNNIIYTKAVIENGTYTYQTEQKTVARDPDGTLTLRVNASKDYKRVRTSILDNWVHLYFEQRYEDAPIPIGDAESVQLKLSFSIPHFEDKTPEGQLDPSLHAVIAVFYMTVMDNNPASPSYGQYINFCVMLYDNRTPITREMTHMDMGQDPKDATNMMVYTMDSSVYAGPVVADGEWHDVDFDILPYYKRALELAQNRGLFPGTKFEDMAVRSVFFGFEVPGFMDTEMKIREPMLLVTKEKES